MFKLKDTKQMIMKGQEIDRLIRNSDQQIIWQKQKIIPLGFSPLPNMMFVGKNVLFIAEGVNIHAYTLFGEALWSVRASDNASNTVAIIRCIAADEIDNVYVVDSGGTRFKYNAAGARTDKKLVKSTSTFNDMDVYNNQEFFVADTGAYTIMGGQVVTVSELRNIKYIKCSINKSTGKIYVIDHWGSGGELVESQLDGTPVANYTFRFNMNTLFPIQARANKKYGGVLISWNDGTSDMYSDGLAQRVSVQHVSDVAANGVANTSILAYFVYDDGSVRGLDKNLQLDTLEPAFNLGATTNVEISGNNLFTTHGTNLVIREVFWNGNYD